MEKVKSVVKTYLMAVILIGTTILLAGCMEQPQPCPVIEPIVKKEIVKVKVPVQAKIPEVTCNFEGDGVTPTKKLLECLILHKRIIEVLKKNEGKEIKGLELFKNIER